MKKLTLFIGLLILALCLLYLYRLPLQRAALEKGLNLSAREFFKDSLRLKSGYIDKELQLNLQDVTGTLASESGPAPIEIKSVRSEEITGFFKPEGSVIYFEGARPAGSQQPGIQGRAELKLGKEQRYHLDADIAGLDFSEIAWLNPDNLRGSSGLVTGKLTLDGKFMEDPSVTFIMTSKDGKVQAKFFSALLPYLPALPTKDRMEQLSESGAVVPFRDAAVRIEMPKPHQMKIFLHIRIPDYNVELNLNFEIRIEEEMSFSELAQIMGFVKVSHG